MIRYDHTLVDMTSNFFVLYLTAKETHIFNIHFIPETLIKFTLNNMNMFDRTPAFVPDYFIRYYTVNNIFC